MGESTTLIPKTLSEYVDPIFPGNCTCLFIAVMIKGELDDYKVNAWLPIIFVRLDYLEFSRSLGGSTEELGCTIRPELYGRK